MKLKQLNVFNNTLKNVATERAAVNTLKQAKKECREWSKLTMAVADLASELKQEIVKSSDLPEVRDPSNGNPFVELAHSEVDSLDQISSSYKNVSDEFRGHKRQAANYVGAERYKRVWLSIFTLPYVPLAVFMAPTYAVTASVLAVCFSKLSKNLALGSASQFSQSISPTLNKDEIKSLDGQLSKIKDIARGHDQTDKIKSLFNQVETLKAKLDSAEHSPFVHKLNAAHQAHAEVRANLVGKDRAEIFSTLHSAMDDLKKSEAYKPTYFKTPKGSKTEARAADIDHFIAKITKRTIKQHVQIESMAMHVDSVGLGSPLR